MAPADAAAGLQSAFSIMRRSMRRSFTWLLLLTALAAKGDALGGEPQGREQTSVRTLRAYLRTGRYAEARRLGDEAGRRKSEPAPLLAILTARAEMQLGLYREARERLEQATVRNPGDLPLRAQLVRVVDAVGDRDTARALIERTRLDDKMGRLSHRDAAGLLALATILRFDNNWDDANATLRAAVASDGRATEGNLEWGALFLEKHAADNAALSFRDVLKQDPQNPDAHVGLARALLDQGYDTVSAERELQAALAVNPVHADALAVSAEIALDAEEFDLAASLVTRLRTTNPRDANAAWLAASRALLLEDRAAYDRERQARLRVRPGDGDFFARTAEALVRHRRYADARIVATDGVGQNGQHAGCLASLGTTLLRLGEETEGLPILRRAWQRDPYNVRTFNLLNLLEKVIPARYVTVATEHFRFRIEPRTRVALDTIVAPFLEETYGRYVARYGFEPTGPIVFELYGDPADYAIRTVGLPRLDVTGACFGKVITSQAPTNAAFNWGLVLSHELAHVFALQLSRSRVPLWFTEGLSEMETARLRPEWRRHDDRALWRALAGGHLPSLASLSRSFVRGTDGEAAYMQAAAALAFLEQRFGFAKIRAALVAFGRGGVTGAVLATLAGQSLEDLDLAFRQYLGSRPGRNLDESARQVQQAVAHLHSGDHDSAERELRRAIELDPTEIDALVMLAQLLGDAGRTAEKLAVQTTILRLEPQSARLAKEVLLASATAGLVGTVAELAPLATFIDPADADVYATQGRALAAQGRHREAIRAFERALLFSPADPDGLHRRLAELFDRIGDTRSAASHRHEPGAPEPAAAGATRKPPAWVPQLPAAGLPPVVRPRSIPR